MTNEEFGKLIKDLRQKNNMTQKDLGEKLHITDKAISKWERGISLPDLEMLNSIAEVFDVPVSNLIDNDIYNSKQETSSKRSFNILLIIIIAILAIFSFIQVSKNNELTSEDLSEVIVGTTIAGPDRIVYKNEKGNYYEFLNGSEEYSSLKGLLQKSITSYTNSGMYLTDDEIDKIHENASFLEFDYKTISKNYIIQLSSNENQAVIRLADKGGRVCSTEISNISKIKSLLNDLTKEQKSFKLDYEEYISSNTLESLESTDNLKKIGENIYQVKIDNLEDYENFSNLYNIKIDKKINEMTFETSEVILTLSTDYDISVKINVGSIKYTYNAQNVDNSKFTAQILIVSKIVNTDCIYNTISEPSESLN